MNTKEKIKAVAYIRTSSAANVGADKDSDKRRYMLRLHHDGVSAREIGRTLGVARSTIQDNVRCANTIGIAWPHWTRKEVGGA